MSIKAKTKKKDIEGLKLEDTEMMKQRSIELGETINLSPNKSTQL